jgi:hypothetical protein
VYADEALTDESERDTQCAGRDEFLVVFECRQRLSAIMLPSRCRGPMVRA